MMLGRRQPPGTGASLPRAVSRGVLTGNQETNPWALQQNLHVSLPLCVEGWGRVVKNAAGRRLGGFCPFGGAQPLLPIWPSDHLLTKVLLMELGGGQLSLC
jgi:hypothetical protein